ncbi:hypothetical protein [Clostridium perfringens]|uniref:hypothetical protein n=1 Tax=Clostridium perfringens TaxID=1502 RepID=UPI002342138A|nr:hypothetical protein [Clostridium perfringens]MDC4245626.1 hypothetical protein [Clostridium perfringens]
MTNLNFKIYDEIFIDPKEFFSKTKDKELNLERLIYDNNPVSLKQNLTGQDFRYLLDGIKEECETEKEYIFITKINKGIAIRHEVYDEFEGEDVVNEWILTC